VVGTGVEWTWQELAARVDTLAAKLVEEDVQPGDVIGVCMSRCPEIIETYLAIAKVGAIAAPVNYKLEAHHLSDLVEVCGMTRVIAEPRFEGLLDLSKPPAKPSTAPGACYLNYTSGSTGRPKGAVTTQAQILANAQATVDGLGFSEDDVFL
jgi:acyl-coenzyme A synthetase/AMP-(fatty) acid ligase